MKSLLSNNLLEMRKTRDMVKRKVKPLVGILATYQMPDSEMKVKKLREEEVKLHEAIRVETKAKQAYLLK